MNGITQAPRTYADLIKDARALSEVPAMISALKEARQWIAKGVADGAYNGCAAPLAPNRWLDRCGAILSRIDGAGDTLPDAPVPAPTGELVTVSADHLAALAGAAAKYADDLETGLEDGTYDDRADLDAVRAALAVVQGEA